jgi:hypothetical protein
MDDLTYVVKAWMRICTEELQDEEALTYSECEFKARRIEHLAEHKREAGH